MANVRMRAWEAFAWAKKIRGAGRLDRVGAAEAMERAAVELARLQEWRDQYAALLRDISIEEEGDEA